MPKPKIHKVEQVAKTNIFCVEQLSLEFSNGATRVYERLRAGGSGAVMIIALNEKNELLLIKEYAAGVEDYVLAFPKGLVDQGESIFAAANRELKEEVGMGAHSLYELKKVTLAPGYLSHVMSIVFAHDLYPEQLQGDEPEPIEVVPVPLDKAFELLDDPSFNEARSIAGLYLAIDHLKSIRS